MSVHTTLLKEVEGLAAAATSPESFMQRLSDHIHAAMARYNWVGFYLVDKTDPRVLVLGPFTGSFTPVPRIPFEQGLCGAAAATGKTLVVDNVAGDHRYLAGSELVKSEIVVPIFAAGKLAGEIDVESYFTDTFRADDDRNFVEACAGVVAKFLKTHPLV
jgi:L-methionine (R)-S-oxide reductase